ncbi:hypothetical protein Tco_1500177 [Tanacetum coccineum]
MSEVVPPIPPPLGANSGNIDSPNTNRVDTMPINDTINTTTITNVAQNVVDKNLSQLLDSRGGSHVTNVPEFDKHDFTSWKVRFLVFLDGLEPYILKTLEDGSFVPMSSLSTSDNPLPKHAFKSLKGEKVNGTFTRLKCLLNDLENNRVIIPQAEVNATFVNSLPKKWLSMNQTQRANNSIKNDSLATMFGKYNYEEGRVDQIYESETQRFTIHASSSKALISNNQFQDSDSDVEEDKMTRNQFMADMNAEYHERALLANQNRFYKRSGRVGTARKPMDKSKKTCFTCGKQGSSEDEGTTKIKAFMAIAKDEPSVGKTDARKHVLDYTHVDLYYVKDQRKNLVNKFNALKQDMFSHKFELLPGNIVKALGGRGRKKENNSSKEVIFTKADESLFEPALETASDSESESDPREPLPPLPKLTGG